MVWRAPWALGLGQHWPNTKESASATSRRPLQIRIDLPATAAYRQERRFLEVPMRLSSRGQVDPFIVMDVMEAARRAEEAG